LDLLLQLSFLVHVRQKHNNDIMAVVIVDIMVAVISIVVMVVGIG
jgi:hypothetical protein